MRLIFITVGLALFLLSSCIESNPKDFSSEHIATLNDSSSAQTNSFDSSYASKLGADDYGMKQYVIAFLYTGNNRPTEKNTADSLQSAHLSNIGKLAEEGKLVLAGPFMDDDSLRGIYIFNTSSVTEAQIWTATDPAIIYGSLKMELKPWYGSAAIMEVNEIHSKIAKINI